VGEQAPRQGPGTDITWCRGHRPPPWRSWADPPTLAPVSVTSVACDTHRIGAASLRTMAAVALGTWGASSCRYAALGARHVDPDPTRSRAGATRVTDTGARVGHAPRGTPPRGRRGRGPWRSPASPSTRHRSGGGEPLPTGGPRACWRGVITSACRPSRGTRALCVIADRPSHGMAGASLAGHPGGTPQPSCSHRRGTRAPHRCQDVVMQRYPRGHQA
jgi:hypothetical protein